jgi:hypothetical protein
MPPSKYHELVFAQSKDLPRTFAGMEVVSDHVGSDGNRHLFLIRNEHREPIGAQPKPRPRSERKAKPRATKPQSQPTNAGSTASNVATAFPGAEVKGA